ncbi:polysaccharide deacetylase family protein [bacterium]|nr:polysaccharide deacetylase family protein [bacterium]
MMFLKGRVFPYQSPIASALLFALIVAATPLQAVFAAQTGLIAPSTNVNSGWQNPQNAYASDNNRAIADNNADIVQYGGFSFPTTTGVINGIELVVEGYTTGRTSLSSVGRPQEQISLSWNGGTNYTSGTAGVKTTSLPLNRETTQTFGGSRDAWGRTWTPEELANLRVKLATRGATGGKLYVDQIRVRIHYTPRITTQTVITSHTPDPSTTNQAYTVNVTVTPASGSTRPSGSVTVTDGTSSCTDTTASNGASSTSAFSCALTSTTAGTKTLTATFTSTNAFTGSSGTASHTVTAAPPPPPSSETFSKGMVSITFDDGTKSVYNAIAARNLLQGLPSTQYVYSIPMYGAALCNGACYTEYMSTADVQNLAAAGHEIASHTRGHRNLSTLSGTDSLFETNGSRLDFIGEFPSLAVTSLAYPYGGFNSAVKQQLQAAGYSGGRTVDIIGADGRPILNKPSTDRFALFSGQVTGTSPVTPNDPLPTGWNPEFGTIQSWIDDAVNNKQWLILTLHEVKDDCGADAYCVTPAKLTQIVNYLKSKGSSIDVVTVGQGLSRMNSAPTSDGAAPVVTVPQTVNNTITTKATSSSGAAVTFTPVVTDSNSGLNALCVLPAIQEEFVFPSGEASGIQLPKVVTSGYTFPTGSTSVRCSASDVGGKVGTYTFTVTVTP